MEKEGPFGREEQVDPAEGPNHLGPGVEEGHGGQVDPDVALVRGQVGGGLVLRSPSVDQDELRAEVTRIAQHGFEIPHICFLEAEEGAATVAGVDVDRQSLLPAGQEDVAGQVVLEGQVLRPAENRLPSLRVEGRGPAGGTSAKTRVRW